MNTAFLLFLIIVLGTLVITYYAAKKTKTANEFYTAGGGLTGWQNGLAIAGDYMSAASFLGIAGMIALFGFDGFFYSIGFLVAYLVVLYLVAEPLRNLGKYTMADMIAARFDNKKIRGVAALNSIVISIFYMIAQLVGAGALISLLIPGLDYTASVLIVGVLMTVYVVFGGMTATSWVQIIKCVLLIAGTFIISLIVFAKFNFNIGHMFDEMRTATPLKEAFLNPGNKFANGLDTLSLNLALVLGTAGLPHILIRFFTVKDAPTARKSVVVATWIIGLFYVMTLFLGFGAAAFVGKDVIVKANAAGNMAAPLLARALGGEFLFAFVSAVAFATILAVVAGLVLSAASAFAHDFYGHIIRKGNVREKEQVRAAKLASVGVAVISDPAGAVRAEAQCRIPGGSGFCRGGQREPASARVHRILEKIQYLRSGDWNACGTSERAHSCGGQSQCMESGTGQSDFHRHSAHHPHESRHHLDSVRFPGGVLGDFLLLQT